MIAMPDVGRERGDQILRVIRDAFDRYHRRRRSDQPHAIAVPSSSEILLPLATMTASNQPLLPRFVAPEEDFADLLDMDADDFTQETNFNFNF